MKSFWDQIDSKVKRCEWSFKKINIAIWLLCSLTWTVTATKIQELLENWRCLTAHSKFAFRNIFAPLHQTDVQMAQMSRQHRVCPSSVSESALDRWQIYFSTRSVDCWTSGSVPLLGRAGPQASLLCQYFPPIKRDRRSGTFLQLTHIMDPSTAVQLSASCLVPTGPSKFHTEHRNTLLYFFGIAWSAAQCPVPKSGMFTELWSANGRVISNRWAVDVNWQQKLNTP